jgi:OOP family OmpA-OmpF porin
MYRILLSFLFIYGLTFGQQLPISSHGFLNKQLFNPSFVGQGNQANVQAGFRSQWVGFNGSPRTIFLGGQGIALNGKLGLGGYLFNDFAGNTITTTGVCAPIAYHHAFNEKHGLSVGVSPVIEQFSMNLLNQVAISPNDPGLTNSNLSQVVADLNFGISYRMMDKLVLGIGTQQLFQSKLGKLNLTNADSNRLARHFNAYASYKVYSNDNISIEPQIMVRSIFVTPIQYDLGVKLNLFKVLGLGAYYRSDDAIYALLGYDGKKFAAYYSYDFTRSNLRNYSSGSHEFTLVYKFPVKIIPDTDKDGITDDKDDCKDQPGPKENKGCPWGDKDGDGVTDNIDNCPDEAGPKENKGCPWGDKDGDGVKDNVDKCPEIAGPIENNGCPWLDSDGDGVHDGIDACKDQAGPVENKGCPWGDKDGDGVTDNVDQCPMTKGPVENNGCPIIEEKIKEQITKAVDNLEFENNSDKILSSSYPALDVLVILLTEKTDWSLNLAGHTDNVGNDEFNMDLSKRRAESTKAYFVSKGIDGARITTEYFGETKPIDTNDTPAGRKKNRRVEMKLVFN